MWAVVQSCLRPQLLTPQVCSAASCWPAATVQELVLDILAVQQRPWAAAGPAACFPELIKLNQGFVSQAHLGGTERSIIWIELCLLGRLVPVRPCWLNPRTQIKLYSHLYRMITKRQLVHQTTQLSTQHAQTVPMAGSICQPQQGVWHSQPPVEHSCGNLGPASRALNVPQHTQR